MPSNYVLCEYVWIDADKETRSKTRVFFDTDDNFINMGGNGLVPSPESLPVWSFDGSSTGQAKGFDSDILIRPQFVCVDPFDSSGFNSYLVLCDIYNRDGSTHLTNNRVECVEVANRAKKHDVWFGTELEYFVYDAITHKPIGWETKKYDEQGKYYCGSGGDRVFGRHIMTEHMHACLRAGLHVRGMNVEVAVGSQFEFQLGELSAVQLSDEFWISKYILNRVCEKHKCYAVYDPKLFKYLNGSGAHLNISSKKTREQRNDEVETEITNICKKLKTKHSEHLAVYGDPELNKLRLTGKHETSSFEEFSYADNSRATSVRTQKGKGYFEDRRPASNCDMYQVTARVLKTICLNE